MSQRYVCVHGHFYQPPRENAWLEAIELQDSAYPYHDWNERVTAECYAPNALSRILDAQDRIVKLVNNYARMSFDFGPTLLSWLEAHAPQVYFGVLEADRTSREIFGGHGSAMAQAYNHVIMPLANDRDQATQVVWGIRDFEHRYARRPDGMWLPETAADLRSLDALASHGIKFTILAPNQALRVRRIGTEAWTGVDGGRVDCTIPYRCNLPSGRSITLFFYDGPTSRAVAFERLLDNGDGFARRLAGILPQQADHPVMAHIATDGESYGHHHRHGDMALAFALRAIGERKDIRLTNYAQFLHHSPPALEVEIHENTSWSCAHGVERWRSDCGCNLGRPGWHQRWRAPLRAALDWLRDTLAPRYEEAGRALFRDPWAARDAYIQVILERSPERVERFLAQHQTHPLSPEERIRAAKLLELQRHALLMYTSCGWFFDEISGIESVQVLQYAARAVQLARELFGDDYEAPFLQRLEQAPSNVARLGNGRRVYEALVRATVVDLKWVAAHFALTSLFENYGPNATVYSYQVTQEETKTAEAGRARLGVGRLQVQSRVTGESGRFTYAVAHLGDHNLHGGVRPFQGDDHYHEVFQEITTAFEHARLTEVIGIVDRAFQNGTYSMAQLFRDEQRKIVNLVLRNTLEDMETSFRRLHERYLPLLRFLVDLGHPLPKEFRSVGEFVTNKTLQRALEAERIDPERVRRHLDYAEREHLTLDAAGLSFGFERHLERLTKELLAAPRDMRRLEALEASTALMRELPFEVDLWRTQNMVYAVFQTAFADQAALAAEGDAPAKRWAERFRAVATHLRIHVPP